VHTTKSAVRRWRPWNTNCRSGRRPPSLIPLGRVLPAHRVTHREIKRIIDVSGRAVISTFGPLCLLQREEVPASLASASVCQHEGQRIRTVPNIPRGSSRRCDEPANDIAHRECECAVTGCVGLPWSSKRCGRHYAWASARPPSLFSLRSRHRGQQSGVGLTESQKGGRESETAELAGYKMKRKHEADGGSAVSPPVWPRQYVLLLQSP